MTRHVEAGLDPTQAYERSAQANPPSQGVTSPGTTLQ
jgi:hypothetical protein